MTDATMNNTTDKVMPLTKHQDITDHTDQVWCARFNHPHPHSTLLATSGADKVIRMYAYNTATGKYESSNELVHQHTRTIRSLSFHRNHTLLASGGFDSQINIYRFGESADGDSEHSEWQMVCNLEGHENEVKCVAYNVTGQLLASCSRDKSIWIWSYSADGVNDEYECMSVLNGHTADVKYVAWCDETTLLSASYDNTIRVWHDDADTDDFVCLQTLGIADGSAAADDDDDTADGNKAKEQVGHTSTVWCIAVNPSDSNQFVSCSDDCSIILWQRPSSSSPFVQAAKLSGVHKRTIFSVDWNADGYIVTGGADNQIVLYKYSNTDGKPTITIQCRLPNAHKNDVNCVQFRPNDNMIVSVSDDTVVSLWRYGT